MAQTLDQQDTFSDTEWWLEQWAMWAMLGMGTGGSSSFAELIVKASDRSLRCMINDDQAMVVDGALATLKKRCPETGSATAKYFLWNGNTSAVARELEVNRKKADAMVKAGIAWVDAHLMMLEFDKTS